MSPACWIAVVHGAPDFGQSWASNWWTADELTPSSWEWPEQQSLMETKHGSQWAYSG